MTGCDGRGFPHAVVGGRGGGDKCGIDGVTKNKNRLGNKDCEGLPQI